MRCRAALAWRSPPRLSRCRLVLPEEAGKGLTPHSAAKAASGWRRPGFLPRGDQEPRCCVGSGSEDSDRVRRRKPGQPFQLDLQCANLFSGFVNGGDKVHHRGGGIVYHRHDEKELNWEPGGVRSGAGIGSPGVSQESSGSSETWEAALCGLCRRR